MTERNLGAAKSAHPTLFRAYSHVRLIHDVHAGNVTFPAGSRGVIVDCHNDGIGYEVEFETPAFRVLTLTAHDLAADHG